MLRQNKKDALAMAVAAQTVRDGKWNTSYFNALAKGKKRRIKCHAGLF